MCETPGSCHFSGSGVIQLLILRFVDESPLHGYLILQKIQEIMGNSNGPESGTIYTLLRRLEKRNILISTWEKGTTKIDRRIYSLTENGRLELKQGLEMIKKRRKLFDELIDYYDTKKNGEK